MLFRSALFHVVTIFPLSWIAFQGSQTTAEVLTVQVLGGFVGIIATIGSGWIAARIGKRTTVGALAAMIGVFSLLTPLLMGGSPVMQDTFILLGFALLGVSYGQASGTVTANFAPRFRYPAPPSLLISLGCSVPPSPRWLPWACPPNSDSCR